MKVIREKWAKYDTKDEVEEKSTEEGDPDETVKVVTGEAHKVTKDSKVDVEEKSNKKGG